MPRRRIKVLEEREPRNETIVIWCSTQTKLRWKQFYDYHHTIDKHTYRNAEVLLNKLLDLYELAKKYLKAEKIDDLIQRLEEILGTGKLLVAE